MSKEKQLLIESCELVSKVKLTKSLKESVKLSSGKAGTLIVRNVPCTILNRRNLNGRIYSTEVLREAVDNARLAMQTKQLLCQAHEHPESSYVAPTEASHVVIDAYIKENVSVVVDGKRGKYDVLFMDWEVLNPQEGKNLRALLEAECSVGTSIRGLGDLNGDMVENYELLGVDCVGQPSSGTFTRMPISESVKVSLEDREPMKEGYVITSSSTDVLRDLSQIGPMTDKMSQAAYASISKTSSKLDSEIDPKTGAETTLVTYETDTSDEVTDLGQALQMAKNILTNPITSIDSVTIENVKEEEPKESVEETTEEIVKEDVTDDSTHLDEYISEKELEEGIPVLQGIGAAIDGVGYGVRGIGKILDGAGGIAQNAANGIGNALGSAGELASAGVDKVVDWAKGHNKEKTVEEAYNPMTSEYTSNHTGSEERQLDDFIYRQYNFVVSNYGFDDPERQFAIDTMNNYRDGKENAENTSKIFGDMADKLQRKLWGESVELTEAKKDEESTDPREGRKFVLRTPNGFVGMDGNALVFKEDPKEALHFVNGKEESGLVHLSGVQKILDTMGVYDIEKYYRKPENDIESTTEVEEGIKGGTAGAIAGGVTGAALGGPLGALSGTASGITIGDFAGDHIGSEEVKPLEEDNGSNTKYLAHVVIEKTDGGTQEDSVPVSGIELDSVIAEVSNLYEMKVKKDEGKVTITVTNTSNGDNYIYNPEAKSLDLVTQPVKESDESLVQDGSKLTIQLDDETSVEKDFKDPVKASVAKAGMEKGTLTGDVMLSEQKGLEVKVDLTWNDKTEMGELYFYAPKDVLDKMYNDFTVFEGMTKEPKLSFTNEKEDTLCTPYITEAGLNKYLQKARSLGYKLSWQEDETKNESIKEADTDEEHADIESGWYVTNDIAGISGPFESKEEAEEMFKDMLDMIDIYHVGNETENTNESVDLDEKLFARPSEASDEYVQEPVKEEVTNDLKVTLTNISWDEEAIIEDFTSSDDATEYTLDDLKKVISELPETLDITISFNDIKNTPEESFQDYINTLVEKQCGLKIKNADIEGITTEN